MWKTLAYLKKNLSTTIPATLLLGLVAGYFFDLSALRAAILPLTILMIFPMMVTLNLRSVFSKCAVRVQLGTQLINLVLIPALAFLLGRLFLADHPLLAFGLLLIGLLPTSGMTISWTGFAKGNVTVAIKMTVIGLVLGALITPLYGNLLMGQAVEIPLARTFTRIALVVFVPMVLGFVVQRALVRRYGQQRFQQELKPRFPLFATLGVLGIIFVAMALKAKALVADPGIVLWLAAPLVVFYLANYTLASIVGKLFFARGDAIALAYGTVMRNLSVALAIALTVFGREDGAEIALIISVAFIIQVQSAAWYVRVANWLFGPAAAPEAAKEPSASAEPRPAAPAPVPTDR